MGNGSIPVPSNESSTDILTISGVNIRPGEEQILHMQLARLYDFTELTMPVKVIRGLKPGPTLFVSAAVHGDEVIGTEIVKRLLQDRRLKSIAGSLIAIPIVNVFGYNNQSRYLPDRRDLNRSFPGSEDGSLASRMAHIFLNEIMRKCTYGIDIHSGAIHRSNLPQIRACLDKPETERVAKAFGVPVILHSKLRDGSVREAAEQEHITMLLFEGGEGLRYDERVIRTCLQGIISVMQAISMLEGDKGNKRQPSAFIAASSYWVRAPQSGAHRAYKPLGSKVEKGSKLGVICDAFGDNKITVNCKSSGIIIGENRLPLVNKGDALFHIATFDDVDLVSHSVEDYDHLLDHWMR